MSGTIGLRMPFSTHSFGQNWRGNATSVLGSSIPSRCSLACKYADLASRLEITMPLSAPYALKVLDPWNVIRDALIS